MIASNGIRHACTKDCFGSERTRAEFHFVHQHNHSFPPPPGGHVTANYFACIGRNYSAPINVHIHIGLSLLVVKGRKLYARITRIVSDIDFVTVHMIIQYYELRISI